VGGDGVDLECCLWSIQLAQKFTAETVDAEPCALTVLYSCLMTLPVRYSLVKKVLNHSAQETNDLNTDYLSITFGHETPGTRIKKIT